jgi:hypothetical protein
MQPTRAHHRSRLPVYLLLTIITTFYLFHNLSAPTNLLVSTSISAGVAAFITTGSA